jgi:hypothetical protein
MQRVAINEVGLPKLVEIARPMHREGKRATAD